MATNDGNAVVISANKATLSETKSANQKALMTDNEIVKLRKAFDAVDVDKDDLITIKEISQVAVEAGYRIDTTQIEVIDKNEGLDVSSRISFKRFLEIFTNTNKHVTFEEEHRLGELQDKFERYDMDGDGMISLMEAQWALHTELLVSPATSLRLLAEFVHLDYQQFSQFYTQVKKKKMEMFEMFGKYDVDCDGLISLDEAHQVLHKELGFTYHRSQQMLNRFDTNKDGMVSYVEFSEFYLAVEEKKRRIRQSFKSFDREGKGYIGLSQASEILQTILGFSEDKSEKVISRLDRNHDEKIDYEEFVEFYALVEDEHRRLQEEFFRCDHDQDGRISEQEFLAMVSSRRQNPQDAQQEMKGYDLDHDGYLSFDEFKKFLNS